MPKIKKPKAMMVDGIPIKPISPAEHRRLERRIKKKYEKLRRRYPEVHGKKVDWISHWYEDGLCFFSVRFTDGQNFCRVPPHDRYGHSRFFRHENGRRRNQS